VALGDGIWRNVATISQEERNRLRDTIIALQQRFYPGTRNDGLHANTEGKDTEGKDTQGGSGIANSGLGHHIHSRFSDHSSFHYLKSST
jgi:hypothetical protein